MQIVIDIPEKIARQRLGFSNEENDIIGIAVLNGTPLPKGHGRLIDADCIKYQAGVFLSSEGEPLPIIHKIATIEMIRDYAPTIIEADKDCRDCKKWSECECGEKGHKNGTSIGYSIGECRDYVEADKEEE